MPLTAPEAMSGLGADLAGVYEHTPLLTKLGCGLAQGYDAQRVGSTRAIAA